MSARSYLKRRLPWWAYPAARAAVRLTPASRMYRTRVAQIQRALGVESEATVRSGPFEGMRCLSDSIGSSLIPKVLGTYELELHDAIERLLSEGPVEQVIDVGCAEGYYAIGLALRCPQARVLAYDSSARARALCRRMAKLNGVADRVHVAGRMGPGGLRAVVRSGTLLICDCEGCERSLIDPDRIPELREAAVIVELHDFIDPTTSTVLVERCIGSHHVQLVHSREREPHTFGELLAAVAPQQRALALAEGRPGSMRWAVMVPRGRAGRTPAGQ